MSESPGIRLRGNPYARPDYFRTDVERGVTRTPSGTRICALPSEFLLGFHEAIEYECGKAASRVLAGAGRKWGALFARRFAAEVQAVHGAPPQDLPIGTVHVALAEAFAAHGYGRLEVDLTYVASGVIDCELADAIMATLIRESDKPVESLMAGLLVAVFSDLAGEELATVQTECPSRGHGTSRFLLSSASRISSLSDWLEMQSEWPDHERIRQRLLGGVA